MNSMNIVIPIDDVGSQFKNSATTIKVPKEIAKWIAVCSKNVKRST